MTRRRQEKERPPWCGRCEPHSRLVDLDTGEAARCWRCHPATQPGGLHAPRIAGPGARHLDAMVRD